MSKQYTLCLEVADEKVATFVRSQKTPDETVSTQYTLIKETEKKNFDTVRMFALNITSRTEKTKSYVHYYYGLIPIKYIEPVIEMNNYNICEVLTTFPYRLFFDIDDTQCSLTISDVKRIMKQHFGLKKSDYTIAGYETKDKHSYHIVAKNYTLTCEEDLHRMKKLVKAVNIAEGFTSNIIDPAVYSKNRNMKCVYQSKPGGNQAIPLHPNQSSSKYNSKDFYIASFVPTDAISYFSTDKVNPMIQSKLKISTDDLPTTKLELPNDFIWTTNDMMKADIESARKLLSLVPYDVSKEPLVDSHKFRAKVAAFCFGNGLDFNSWFYKTKPSSTRKEKMNEWCKGLTMEFACSIPNFTKWLAKWYPELTIDNPNTGYFINSFENITIVPTVIQSEYIQPEHFLVKERVLLFNLGMGGGKTTATLKELKRQEKKTFVWLAPRQTLVQNTSGRMNKEYDLQHISHMDVGADKTKLRKAKHLIICNQSLHYLEENQTYDIVIIDEIETVLLSWLDESTHGKNLKDNFRQFCNIIKNASKVILLDAFVTTKTINLLISLGIKEEEIKLYTSIHTPKERNLIYNKTEDEIVNKIVDAIVNGEKSYIFYPFKKPSKKHMGIIEFDTYLKNQVREKKLKLAKTDAEKVSIYQNEPTSLLYFAESKEKNNLGDINTLWGDVDYILTTSSITVGVNYEHKNVFHNVFLLASGATNVPRDVIQSSMRIRHPINTDINYHLYDVSLHNIEKFPSYFHSDDDIYKNLTIQNLREIQAGFVDAFYKLCSLTNYKLDIEQEAMYKIKQRKNFINTMYETSNLIEYNKVPIVTDEEKIQSIQTLMYSRCADMVDRLIIERYYFDIQFRNLGIDERAHIWNTNKKDFFKGINDELISMVNKDNDITDIVNINPRSFIVSDDTYFFVKKHYSIVKSAKPDTIVCSVINDILGFEAIRIKTDKTKHKLVTVSDVARTLYVYHLKKLAADKAEKELSEVKFIEETKVNLTKGEWRDQWYATMTDEDMIPVTTVYEDEAHVCKYVKPWDVDALFYTKPVPQKHENSLVTKLDPLIYKPFLPSINGVLPPPLPTIKPTAPKGAKPDSAKAPRPSRAVVPAHC